MTAPNTSQNMTGPLEDVAASYRDAARPGPVSRPVPTGPPRDSLADFLQLGLEQPAAIRRLHDAVRDLDGAMGLGPLLPRLVDGATALMDAEFANIQLIHPRDGSLVLVSQSGFDPGFLDHFAVVRDGGSVCGQAAQRRAQAVVADVQDDPAFVAHRRVFRTSGVRAVQSTPLIDATGRIVGMISTHATQAGRPSELDLRSMLFYGRLAGEAIALRLNGNPAEGDSEWDADPLGLGGSRLVPETTDRLFAAALDFARASQRITDATAAKLLNDGLCSLDEAVRAMQQEMAHRLFVSGTRGSHSWGR